VSVQPIRLFGDPILRTAADPVTVFDKELRTLVADLAETMLDAPGVGLAAPQIGVGLRVFTYRVSEDEEGHLVNPVLHFPSDEEQDGSEGCLSVPGLSFDCRRREHVVAHGQNMYGDPITIEGAALLARCVQHETDHLDGVMFIDRLDPEIRKEAMREIRAAAWGPWAGVNEVLNPAAPAGSGQVGALRPTAREAGSPIVKLSPHPTVGGRF
jgi:peptide deformylase